MKPARKTVNIVLVALLAVGAVIIVVWLSSREGGYSEPSGTYHSPTAFAMDTTLDITIQGRTPAQAKADADAAIALAHKIEAETSQFKKGSDVQKINAQAGVAPVAVSDDTLLIVDTALRYSKLMNGAFDITIAPVVKMWGFYNQQYRVPTEQELAAARALVGYDKVAVNDQARTVLLQQKGMSIDLGGIAKGYAVGEIYKLLKARGVKHALINFGGAIGAVGDRIDGQKWVIGIKNPRGKSGSLVGEISVKDAFVSSSGDYERFFTRDGVRYFHIFDPATGRNPTGVMSTTVVGPNAMLTDTLTKILVMGPAAGMRFIASQPEYEALLIDKDGKVVSTPGMKSHYDINAQEHI
jgi:FAD:protein FMN transferase